MKRQSIFFTLAVTFVITLLLVISSFVILLIGDYKNESQNLRKKYFPIAKMIVQATSKHNMKRAKRHNVPSDEYLKESVKAMNLEMISKTGLQNAISYNPLTKVLVEKKSRRTLARVLLLNDDIYLYLKHRGETYLLKDNNSSYESSRIYIILAFGVILLTLILSFITTLKRLYPLKILKEKVKTLGDENFDFECCNSDDEDEVSLLAREFKNTALKLKNIKEARNVFIRNIMHELKTPITKGKFLTELENNEENDEKMKNVFSRLELLINEFSSIEELISSNQHIEKNEYYLNDIIDNSIDSLLLDDEVSNNEFSNIKINVNFKLFCVAVKNLIDNAVKYSPNKKVTIKTDENSSIIFENEGRKLIHPLESYYEPFFANEDKSKEGFGLGLYIVNSILRANDFKLEYKYEDNKNIFIIKTKD